MPGVNLELAGAEGGLNETIVLTSRLAPETFLFPLHLTGLTAAVDRVTGDVVYRNLAGSVVGSTPRGTMTDSKVDPRSGDPATSRAVTYTIIGFGSNVILEVTLNHAWLADPARLYPVSVDPTISPAADAGDDTYAYSPDTNNNSTDTVLKVGTWDSTTNVSRSFMHFSNLSAINGNQVSAATLWLYESHSFYCGAATLTDIYQVTQAWSGPAVTTFPGPTLGALAGSASTNVGDTCGDAGWVSFNVTSTVANWASTNGASNLGLAIVAGSETNNNFWKQFYSWDESSGGTGTTPYLNITWNTAATAPSAPTNAVAIPAATSANITWTQSASNGGSPITAYYVNAFDGNTGALVSQVSVCATCTAATITGLQPHYPYFFGVYALNAVNFSAPDYTATITTTPPPGVPQGAVATPGNGSATMAWAPPVPNGGTAVTDYVALAYYTNGTYSGQLSEVCATCYEATVAGLTNGTAYDLYVVAQNPAGNSPAAESGPITPNANVPGPPTSVAAYDPGTGSMGVVWYPPTSSGTSSLILYAVNTYDLATGYTGTSAVIDCPCGPEMFTAITGLVTGHNYFFAVYAYNTAGYGPAAITATVTPNPAIPGPPTAVTATGGNATLTVTWAPPAATGTSAIASYLLGAVDQVTGGLVTFIQNCPCTNPQTATIPGVTNGDSYQTAVYAQNASGYGPPGVSNLATPTGPPPTTTTSSTVPSSTTTSSTTVPSSTTTTSTTVPSSTTTTSTTVPSSGAVNLPSGATGFDKQGNGDSSSTINCLVQAGRTVNIVDLATTADGGNTAEVAVAQQNGQYVAEVQGYYPPAWPDASEGTSRGTDAATAAAAAGYKGTIFLDIESAGNSTEPIMVTWVVNWATAVNGAGFAAGIYLGADDPLTQQDFNNFYSNNQVQHFWLSASSSADVKPAAGYQAVQTAVEQPLCGLSVDPDTLSPDANGNQVTGLAPS